MESLNSTDRRKLSAAQSMRQLEKTCSVADARIAIRKDVTGKSILILAFGVGLPISAYWLYHTFAPTGFMMNNKSGSGAYLHYLQNIMYRPHSQTKVYRPEIELKEQTAAISDYTRRIQARKAAGEQPEGRLSSNWF